MYQVASPWSITRSYIQVFPLIDFLHKPPQINEKQQREEIPSVTTTIYNHKNSIIQRCFTFYNFSRLSRVARELDFSTFCLEQITYHF